MKPSQTTHLISYVYLCRRFHANALSLMSQTYNIKYFLSITFFILTNNANLQGEKKRQNAYFLRKRRIRAPAVMRQKNKRILILSQRFSYRTQAFPLCFIARTIRADVYVDRYRHSRQICAANIVRHIRRVTTYAPSTPAQVFVAFNARAKRREQMRLRSVDKACGWNRKEIVRLSADKLLLRIILLKTNNTVVHSDKAG